MNKHMRVLCIKALNGSGEACRKLGIVFLTGKECPKDRQLAKVCLRRGAELGDEEAYFLYHRLFSRGRKVIDDHSYQELWEEYEREGDEKKKRKLKKYLNLGTVKQREKQRRRQGYGKYNLLSGGQEGTFQDYLERHSFRVF